MQYRIDDLVLHLFVINRVIDKVFNSHILYTDRSLK